MAVPHTWRGARPTLLVIVLTACLDTRAPVTLGEAPEPPGRAVQAYTGGLRAGAPIVAAVGTWKIVQAADFNGDGLADALWTDPRTGAIAVWLLRGTQLLEAGPVIPGLAGSGWAPITAADFSLDGMADVSWFDATSPHLAIWLMRATHVAEPGAPIPGPRGAGWAAVMAGDCNGDGMADVLWYNARESRFSVWLSGGTGVFEPGPEIPGPAGEGWVVPTIGDFNDDGMGDILWFNALTGRISIWLMHGTSVLEPGPEIPGPSRLRPPTSGSGWVAVTGADFNGDGMVDVIWNDADANRMAIWLMQGTHVLESGAEIVGPPGAGWSVGSAGDTDGDGMADALWQNIAASKLAIWTMSGTHVVEPGPLIPGPP